MLMPLLALAVLTGYCVKYPGLIEPITLGLLEGYAHCSSLHSTVIPGPLSLAAGVHALLSAEATARRLKASRAASYAFLAYKLLAWMLGSVLAALGILDIAGLL